MKNISGNEAVALAAVNAGATVITGYPGTPSSEAVASLWGKKIEGVEVQWSTNEKVAFEIAAAASWAGQKALCTMKMSGLNVAYDSLISVVYSGCTGALVLYVCDDPGVSAGMPEQDVRGFAKMSDMPVIDLTSVEDSYAMTQYAFALSEKIQSPVMLRSVTSVALSHASVDLPEMTPIPAGEPKLIKDAAKFTKAGAKICMDQHAALLASLEKAREIIHEDKLNEIVLHDGAKLGLIAAGVMGAYMDEGVKGAKEYGFDAALNTLFVRTAIPAPTAELIAMIDACDTIVVIEENEPYVEHAIFLEAYKRNKQIKIIGKEDGTLSRIGSFDAMTIASTLLKAVNKDLPKEMTVSTGASDHCAARPIGVCAGCPHRGVFMGINDAIKKAGYKKDEVVVTGDIGCTILGMSPPFNTLWTEVSMGASMPMAQGFYYAGVKTPVIATIGDSTFVHGGMPGLINAVWNDVNMTAIIMDNGWTCMTGMQVNPGTAMEFQRAENHHRVDIKNLVPAMGVEHFEIVDPYDVPHFIEVLTDMMKKDGVKVILARRECAIQANRRKIKYNNLVIDEEKCTRCKACIRTSGCPALVYDGERVFMDKKQCNGCGICASTCKFGAIVKEG
ncbi:indolepyruvate ferredoxin oxidoreductase subunit alpha [Christensenellaceae bacterium OttesenSCG-928-M15]|nr:indolepyruvate ferredoxin oxidoreductase subunit alpha [Christensenellaceae bacterium OttesenSCG-928-M15]